MKYVVVRSRDGEYTVVWEHSTLTDRDGYRKVGMPSSYEEASELAKELTACEAVQES